LRASALWGSRKVDVLGMSEQAKLYIIATPIGNMADMTYRAVDTLKKVDALACEDTRVTRRVLEHYDIPKPKVVFACHDHNEFRAAQRVVSLLEEGLSVAYCSDAGMPGISDPGYVLVRDVRDAGYEVDILPGASAPATALIASGLPYAGYAFFGFPPRKTGQRQRVLERVAALRETLIFFESPHRLGAFLADIHTVLGDRQAAVCFELTKKFERVHKGWVSELAESYAETKPKGEICVVIAGSSPKFIREVE
jgi:16S rRNA (cytidine1402-2'-O)-methyltransferase